MPMRLSKLGQWLKQHNIVIAPASKHFAARKDGFPVYPIPAHNGLKTEIPDKYLKGLCKHFGIDPKTLPI
jgi:hypothetical protein